MKRPNRKRQPITLTLDPEVVAKVRALGGNLSRIAESALKDFISRNRPENSLFGDCPASYDNPMYAKSGGAGEGIRTLEAQRATRSQGVRVTWLRYPGTK